MNRSILAIAIAFASPGVISAQEGASILPIHVTAAADPVSTYVFRGVNVTHAPAVQPWATVSLGSTNVSLTAWASFAVTDRDRIVPYSTMLTRGGTDEVDLTAAFSRTVGPVALGAGYIAYIYPSDEQAYTTQEIYGTLGLATVLLTPTLSVFYDFDGGDAGNVDAIEGLYASLSIARSIPLGVPLDVGASIGYTDQEALRADHGLNDANVSLATAIPVGRLVITPGIVYTHLFNGAVVAEHGDDTVWAKLQLKLAL